MNPKRSNIYRIVIILGLILIGATIFAVFYLQYKSQITRSEIDIFDQFGHNVVSPCSTGWMVMVIRFRENCSNCEQD